MTSGIMETMSPRKYSLLIVDDEEAIAQRIKSKITESMGFEVIGLASNGVDALEMMERHQPDALMTDIRMPYIDGIELAKRVRQLYPKTKIAFISGYDEFEYAKEAIHLDVVSYLSKPIDTAELQGFLSRLKTRLDEEHQALFNQERLDDMFVQNHQALLENQFNSLLHVPSIQVSDLQRFRLFGLDLEKGSFLTGLIEIDAVADFYEVEYLRIFLVNLLHKKFDEDVHVYTFNSGFGFVFILQTRQQAFNDIENRLQEVLQTKNEFSSIHVQIGLSDIYAAFKEFPNSVIEAKKALSYSPYMNAGPLIFYRDIVHKKTVDLKLSRQDIDRLQSVIKHGSESEIRAVFQSMSEAEQKQKESLLNNQYYLVNLAYVVMDFANGLNLELEEILDHNLMDTLKSFDRLKDVYAYVEDLVFKLKSLNHQSTQNSVKDLFEEAYQYLMTHYQDPLLGMESVGEHLGISVSYLSSLFKKHLESSFNKELIKIRMEKAQELLMYTPKKIYEIAQEVGYSDVYYFSYSFKKYTMKTPKEYRSETKN